MQPREGRDGDIQRKPPARSDEPAKAPDTESETSSLNGRRRHDEVKRLLGKWQGFQVREDECDVLRLVFRPMLRRDGDHGTGDIESDDMTDTLCEMHRQKACSTPRVERAVGKRG